jgi:hypothetical protein
MIGKLQRGQLRDVEKDEAADLTTEGSQISTR